MPSQPFQCKINFYCLRTLYAVSESFRNSLKILIDAKVLEIFRSYILIIIDV